MQCCVPNCGSNELKPNKSENSGITYHEFPKDPQTRSRWMQGLRLGDWTPNAESYICSLHLSNEDFVASELCAVKTDDVEVPVTFRTHCRICLCSDRKVYNIGENDIAQQYELLTARKACVGDVLPQYICWECKARLASFARLRSVALRSLALLHEFYENVNSKTTEDIQSIIDRNTNKLTSTLILNNTEIVDYPPKGELMVEIDIKPDNSDESNLENRNDNYKRTKVSKTLNKRRKRKNVQNENENHELNLSNCTKVHKRKESTNIKKENDNSDSNDENDNLANRTKALNKRKKFNNSELKKRTTASKAMLKGENRTELKYKNDNDINDNLENLDNDNIKDETASKSDDINSNSDLEDIIYDSDTSKSENGDINRKVDSHLAKINFVFNKKKLSKIKRHINKECTGIETVIVSDSDKEIAETFNIEYFTKEEQLKEFLLRKESNNYKNAGFKCDVCYRGFVHEKAFNSHQIKHTDVHGPIKCTLCGLHFLNTKKVKKHLRMTHQIRYSCKKCNYVTGAQNCAKLHVLLHKGTVYNCSQCDKTFQKKNSLLSHTRKQHTSDIVCHLCGNSFVSERGLLYHKVRSHKLDSLEVPEDGPRCVECNIQFSTDAALTTHYQESNKHKHELPDDGLRKRKGSSGAPKPVYAGPLKPHRTQQVTCEICGEVMPNFVKYRWHFQRQHPDKARSQYPGHDYSSMCEICGLVCASWSQLLWHKDIHSDIKKYSCQECDKQFKTKQSLVSHQERHKGKRYSCDVCDKTFATLMNVERHKINHKNLKFDCNICGKSFKHPMNRQNHIKYVHLKKPLPVRRNRVKAKK